MRGSTKMMKINLSLIGRPGSGKGTYGNLLSKALNCPLVVMGDVLRDHVQRGTEIGKKVADYQKQGKLADDSVVTSALLTHLREVESSIKETHQSKFGFILDGFPRTISQAKILLAEQKSQNDSLTEIHWPERFNLSFAVNIDVPDSICIEKMKGRRKCLKCNESFNLSNVDTPDGFFMPPNLPVPPCKNCDMDTDWSQRSDDTEEIFVQRMKEYHEQSTVVNEFFRDQGKLVDFIPYKGIKDMPILQEIVNKRANSSNIDCNTVQ